MINELGWFLWYLLHVINEPPHGKKEKPSGFLPFFAISVDCVPHRLICLFSNLFAKSPNFPFYPSLLNDMRCMSVECVPVASGVFNLR